MHNASSSMPGVGRLPPKRTCPQVRSGLPCTSAQARTSKAAWDPTSSSESRAKSVALRCRMQPSGKASAWTTRRKSPRRSSGRAARSGRELTSATASGATASRGRPMRRFSTIGWTHDPASREDEEAIESIFFDSRFRVAAWSEVGSIRSDDTANHRYLEAILAKVDVASIRKSAFTVVVDPGNGAGCVVTPYLLRSLGCRVISLNAQPDGAFPGAMPEPIPYHLGDLMRVVSEVHADLGIAHDGDADRAIFVEDKGSFAYANKSLALLAKAAIQGRGGTVVTPVSPAGRVDDVVRAAGRL